MSEELKPCPFCGSEATNQRFAPNDGKPYATCGNTECSMHNVGMRYEGWNTRHIPEGYAMVPVESLQRAAEWFTESQGWNWLEYEDKPLDIDEMLQCVEELKKFKAMIAAATETK